MFDDDNYMIDCVGFLENHLPDFLKELTSLVPETAKLIDKLLLNPTEFVFFLEVTNLIEIENANYHSNLKAFKPEIILKMFELEFENPCYCKKF